MRRRALTFEQAHRVQREAEGLLDGLEFEVDSLGVLEPVSDSECSAYECEFVALAIQLRTTGVTMDRKLLRAFPAHAVALTAG